MSGLAGRGREFAAAISEHTAMVLYVMNDGMQPSLEEVIKVAHAAGVPVLVDAAGQAMPPSNLRKYLPSRTCVCVCVCVSPVDWPIAV